MKSNILSKGSRISRVGVVGSFGAPNALNPNGICPSAWIRIPTHTINPTFSSNPLTHKNRAVEFSHARVMMNDGYTDIGSAGERLPISVARAKVRTSEPASFGEMANTRLEVATRIIFRESDAINSTIPRSGCRREPRIDPGKRKAGNDRGRVRSDASGTHSMSVKV